jgi:hypothetical protein
MADDAVVTYGSSFALTAFMRTHGDSLPRYVLGNRIKRAYAVLRSNGSQPRFAQRGRESTARLGSALRC